MKRITAYKALSLSLLVTLLTGCNFNNGNNSSGSTSTTQGQSFDGREFDISENQDKSLTLACYLMNGSYMLSIYGTGIGRDYSSVESVPWNSISNQVTSIDIENGIEYIGDYYFTNVSLEYVILPQSVSCVSRTAFNAQTIIYTYGTDLSVNNDVYYYSESQPLEKGNFFHMVNGVPTVWGEIIVKPNPHLLFIGNSFTWRQISEDDPAVPKYFKAICEGLNYPVTYDFVVKSSHKLSLFADPTDEMGAKVENYLTTKQYDYVILQEQSTLPLSNYAAFNSAVKKLKTRIDETQDNCKTVLYETWGSPASASTYGGTVSAMEASLRTAYTNCANENNCRVNYVGKVFTYVYENVSSINIYADDNRHQSDIGAYLSAAVHARSLFGLKVSNTSDYCGFNIENAKTLLGIVDELI